MTVAQFVVGQREKTVLGVAPLKNKLLCGLVVTVLGSCLWSVPALLMQRATQIRADDQWLVNSVNELKASSDRWIQVDLSEQMLTAWEGNSPIYSILVSTGSAVSPTPVGVFTVQAMYDSVRVEREDNTPSDIPHVLYFATHYAIHGTYWHQNFGTPVSRGSVNVAVDHAAWLYYWASLGVPVVVQP
ncbi:MAG: L,D-transpeptidase [Leptolyngbyaceae cyanobacterium SL_7_1]|nr:L,D-transpeptidase [Leptolyngbyaceae cyanobacterium SL_7_1]